MTIRIALVGFGQIARSHHVPAIAENPAFQLAAVVNPVDVAVPDGVPLLSSFAALQAEDIGVDAVAICTPPAIRPAVARQALAAGLHVLLEKPPAATVAEARNLGCLAARNGCSIFAAWHSVFAAGVPVARALIAAHGLQSMAITWRENADKWHPGATWLWGAEGFGVFDPGMNALSIALATTGAALVPRAADLTFRPGQKAPVTATVSFTLPDPKIAASAIFDSGYTGSDETWTIDWTLGDGSRLVLSDGGATLEHDGRRLITPRVGDVSSLDQEYPALYRHFGDLITQARSELDIRPLQIVTDILVSGVRRAA